MKLVVKTAGKLAEMLRTVVGFVDETNLQFTTKGVYFEAMDSSHISMLQFHLYPSFFETYEVPAEGIGIRLQLDTIVRLLERGQGDKVEIQFDAEKKKLKLLLSGKVAKTFETTTFTPEAEKIPTPKDMHTVSITLPTADLLTILEDSSELTSHIKFETGEFLTADAHGDTISAEFAFPNARVVRAEGVKALSTYNVEYLLGIIKKVKAPATLMTFATDKPATFLFEYSEDGLPNGLPNPPLVAQLKYILAPRVAKE